MHTAEDEVPEAQLPALVRSEIMDLQQQCGSDEATRPEIESGTVVLTDDSQNLASIANMVR